MSTLANYCFEKGLSLEDYEAEEIALAKMAKESLAVLHRETEPRIGNGMWYPLETLPGYNTVDDEWKPYLVQEMKQIGFEFVEEGMWRF